MDSLASRVPAERIRVTRDEPVRADGAFVLYWMIAARRPHWNFALDRAVEWARHLRRPLLVLEALRAGYRWANDRTHRFVLDGMRENLQAFSSTCVTYHPYVEPRPGDGAGLVEALAHQACVIVSDDSPMFFLPRIVEAASRRSPVRFEVVDGVGLLPLSRSDRAFPTAYGFRRHLQRELPDHVEGSPRPRPLARLELPSLALPPAIEKRWPSATAEQLDAPSLLATLPIDHSVSPGELRGGPASATRRLRSFVDGALSGYQSDRNHPDRDAASRLSPYLHFGHVSAHQVFSEVLRDTDWTPGDLGLQATGARQGWWGLPPSREAFLDQLVTWRELGHVFARHRPDYDRYESLPDWARATLAEHAADPRPVIHSFDALDDAGTDDEIWNAAQRQLRETGSMHNYLRMLWGKRILEWSATPREALETMIELNNRYALDGRDPNSYSGIFWILGRFDRPWAPERPIFGRIRYMSSANTRRKLRLRHYLARYGPDRSLFAETSSD